MGVTWVKHGCIMGVTWVKHECNMGVTWVQHGRNFSNRLGAKNILGGSEDVKCSRYHQNLSDFGFLFRFGQFSHHCWGSSVQHEGGGGSGPPKEIKVTRSWHRTWGHW